MRKQSFDKKKKGLPICLPQQEVAGTKRLETLKDNGWGFRDTKFVLNKAGCVELTGNRYLFSGNQLPNFVSFAKQQGIDITYKTPPQSQINVPPIIQNARFIEDVSTNLPDVILSTSNEDRVRHSHGHTQQELWDLRHGKLSRLPDAVLYPNNHDDVVKIVKMAVNHNVMIIPYGGGTSVTLGLACPANETRSIVSLDMSLMSKILFIDEKNLTVNVEAGCVGIHLERELNIRGYVVGHEPDSNEFSTVGGWVATRASGMKRSTYGNIEDLLVDVKVVTAIGTFEQSRSFPRVSCGPSFQEIILGSEGTLGIVTEATLKLRPVPEVTQYGSLLFPTMEDGLKFIREVARLKLQPSSIRLMDNDQFRFGGALKPKSENIWLNFIESITKLYLFRVKCFDAQKVAVCTLLYEGSKSEVSKKKAALLSLAKSYHGIDAGADNGKRGYWLTYMIAYIRDFSLEYSFIAESFETSVPWDCLENCIKETKARIRSDCIEFGVTQPPLVACRVTQVYDVGVCIYFYFGFLYRGIDRPLDVYAKIEERARESIMEHGGSISHHHGVGKLRSRFMSQAIGDVGIQTLVAIKRELDPLNTFGNNNLIQSRL
eukprot:GHVL01014075.1.p1 GENE.GHVL01014075.1~~GHVL01014075.1.p1  ORF type:complete len:601 (-),score=76.36 GHVL01014075.1:107-1909(-)